VDAKINDYFKLKKHDNENEETYNKKGCPKKPKNEILFRLPKKLTPKQKEILQKSILLANIVKGFTFNDDLCYTDPDCPKDMNKALYEPGLNKLSQYNKLMFYTFKEKSRKGEYAPLEIVEDELQVSSLFNNRDI
jgi:hypothetical protein